MAGKVVPRTLNLLLRLVLCLHNTIIYGLFSFEIVERRVAAWDINYVVL